jgi:hypothetical protein
MSRATLEASGHLHQATTHSIWPRQPTGLQKYNDQKIYTYFASNSDGYGDAPVLCHVHCSRALLEGGIYFDRSNRSYKHKFIVIFFIVNLLKRGRRKQLGHNKKIVSHIKLMRNA